MGIEKDIKRMKLDMSEEDLGRIINECSSGPDGNIDLGKVTKEINNFINARTTIVFENVEDIKGGMMTHFVLPEGASKNEKAILSALHIIFQTDNAQNFIMQTAENIMRRRHEKCTVN